MSIMKTAKKYEAEGWHMVMDDTLPEVEIIWTEEMLAKDEEFQKVIKEKYKHHFE